MSSCGFLNELYRYFILYALVYKSLIKNGGMNMRKKRALSLCLALITASGLLAGCGGEQSQTNQTNQTDQQTQQDNTDQSSEVTRTGETVTEKFTVWLRQGEDSSYYATYDKNPAIEYLTSRTWGLDENGNDVKIELEFIIPIAGSEQENYNTLLATGEYPDIMQVVAATPVTDLYEEGIALDISEYVENLMPDYKSFLDANPGLGRTATNVVDGESKYIQLYGYIDKIPDMYAGYLYRRDWIVKYGTNPSDGSSFSGSYTIQNEDGSWNKDSWSDDVIFPSGGSDPIYISDWEWMFEIFSIAMNEEGITDGYCISLPYSGTGELACGFGGGLGGAAWYKTPEDTVVFGGTTDDFRAYLQCVNTWYKNGWIDEAFAEHTSDMFFRIDDAKVRQGKVGMWYGTQVGGVLNAEEGLTDGFVAYGARQPINDIYGSADQQNKTPYAMYQLSQESTSWVITDKVKGKNMEALFNMLNYMCSEEGGMLMTFGLNKEQYEETQNELYTRYGLTEGSYRAIETDEGTQYVFVDTILNDGGSLINAVRLTRFFALEPMTLKGSTDPESKFNSIKQWTWYPNTGRFEGSFTSQLSSDNAQTFSQIQANLRDYMNKSVPSFVTDSKDPYSDTDWQSFVDEANKNQPEEATMIYQEQLNQLNQ